MLSLSALKYNDYTKLHSSEKAFKEWLEKQNYDRELPTGPKGRQRDRDDTKKESKKGNGSQRESLAKPNSVAAKSTGSTATRKTDRRPDSIPTVRYPHHDSPTISRHATNLTQVMEDGADSGIHETSDQKEVT